MKNRINDMLVSVDDDGTINLLDEDSGETLVTCSSINEAFAFTRVTPHVVQILSESSDPTATASKLLALSKATIARLQKPAPLA